MNELVVSAAIGLLTGSGVWLLLRPRTFQVAVGLSLLSYAVNLFIFVMGRLRTGAAPIVSAGAAADPSLYADPLPQALVLTAMTVVASFEKSTSPSASRHLADLASLPPFPGAFVVAVLGVGHGPGGMPNDRDVLVIYVLTFLLWWGVIYCARAWWTALDPIQWSD